MDGLKFKSIRIDVLRVNQSQLAQALGVSSNTVSRYELGVMSICNRTKYSMLYFCGLGQLPPLVRLKAPTAKSKGPKRKKRR